MDSSESPKPIVDRKGRIISHQFYRDQEVIAYRLKLLKNSGLDHKKRDERLLQDVFQMIELGQGIADENERIAKENRDREAKRKRKR